MSSALATLEEDVPWIAWREPVEVVISGQPASRFFACRVCIAHNGLAARDVTAGKAAYVFATKAEAARHVDTHVCARQEPA